MGIFRFPGRIYDHVYNGYGWFGVAFGALAVVLMIVIVIMWFDRRR